MKNLFLLAIMAVSVSAYSKSVFKEFDPQQEEHCYAELTALKCVTSKGEEDHQCAETKKAQLSKSCAQMHEEKKSN